MPRIDKICTVFSRLTASFVFAFAFSGIVLAEGLADTPTPTPTVTPDGPTNDAELLGVATPNPDYVKIYKHFRFKDGETFVPGPTPTPPVDVAAYAKKFEEEALQDLKDNPIDFMKGLQEGLKAPQLSACTENKTDSIPAEIDFPGGVEGEKSPSYDILVMDQKDVPEDYMMIFGASTLLVPFIKEVPNSGWDLIFEVGVPCLPFRIRFQGGRIYTDFGVNALKNYAKGPKGEYHPYIKDKYQVK